MKILFISDTHGFHGYLNIPKDLDMIIFGGDCSNPKETMPNMSEVMNFLTWYHNLNIKYKIMIAGNHDTSIERGKIDFSKYPTIIYLEHNSVEIEGIKIFGSPYTPSFGVGWAYNVNRGKLTEYWKDIPRDTDILITHGPPKGILDTSIDRNGDLEYCGDKELLNQYYRNSESIKPKYHIFGHIHDSENNLNAGTRTVAGLETIFINASCVEDGRFDLGLTSHGITMEI